jgi:hypothetical protein
VAIERNAKPAMQSKPRNGRWLILNDGILTCVLGDLRTKKKPLKILWIGEIKIENAYTNNFIGGGFVFKKVQFTLFQRKI